MTTQSRSLRLARSLVQAPFAWPGGYPRYAITNDGEALCPPCCQAEQRQIGTTTGTDGWCLLALAINWEDADLTCAHCATSIPSAYGADAAVSA
jgi:hypothetical protein